MGAGSFLGALVARKHSLLPVRHCTSSKLAPAQVHDIFDSDEKLHSTTHADDAQYSAAAEQQLLCSSRFHRDLAERLQQLQLHGSGTAHLNWLLDALASTLSTHSSLQLVLTGAAASSASSAATLAKLHRADEVLCMLDVCTALKRVSDDMERQFGGLQHALQCVGHALNAEKLVSSSRIRAAARRLSACLTKDRPHTNILCISKNQYQPLAEARASLLLAAKRDLQSTATSTDPAATLLSQAVDGAMLTSLLVLASAVSSLAPPSPRKSSRTITGSCKMIAKYLGAKGVSATWAAPLRQLHHDLRQEEMSAAGGSLFQEVQGLHSAATNLHTTITTPGVQPIELAAAKLRVQSLRKGLGEAQACITMFRTHMAAFFQALVALRLALLDS